MGGVTERIPGPGPIRGAAPAAQFFVTSRIDANGVAFTGDVQDLFDIPHVVYNARISNHSYGLTIKEGEPQIPYGIINEEYDDYILDANNLLVCWSQGNFGERTVPASQVSGRSCCKNVLTVGATSNERKISDTGDYDPSQLAEADIYGVAPYSSRGPTTEQRRKPDICAPGTAILGPISRSAIPPPEPYGPSTNANFWFGTGASMATPMVSGSAAVLREALGKCGVKDPSAALLKVLLIHGAVDMYRGVSATIQPHPEYLQGFGRINMGGSLHVVNAVSEQDATQKTGGYVDAPDDTKQAPELTQGATNSLMIQVPVSTSRQSRTLKVTLTWMDRGGPLLVNQLGLGVTLESGERRNGNRGTVDRRNAPGDFDAVNNVQQVVWENMPGGRVVVSVECVRAFDNAETVKYALAWSLE